MPLRLTEGDNILSANDHDQSWSRILPSRLSVDRRTSESDDIFLRIRFRSKMRCDNAKRQCQYECRYTQIGRALRHAQRTGRPQIRTDTLSILICNQLSRKSSRSRRTNDDAPHAVRLIPIASVAIDDYSNCADYGGKDKGNENVLRFVNATPALGKIQVELITTADNIGQPEEHRAVCGRKTHRYPAKNIASSDAGKTPHWISSAML
jgi:hypothetical protein